ncbi:transposase [Streptomyces sp. NPDC055768]
MRTWLEETWPAIRATAKAENGEVLFADQVGIRSDQVTGRTWGEKGRTPIVRRTGNRFSVNAMSAISAKGRMHFMVFTETLDAKVMCRFLDRLIGHFRPQDPPWWTVTPHTALMWSAHGWPTTPTGSSCTSCPRTDPN